MDTVIIGMLCVLSILCITICMLCLKAMFKIDNKVNDLIKLHQFRDEITYVNRLDGLINLQEYSIKQEEYELAEALKQVIDKEFKEIKKESLKQ